MICNFEASQEFTPHLPTLAPKPEIKYKEEKDGQISLVTDEFSRDTKDCGARFLIYGHKDYGAGSHRWLVADGDPCNEANCTSPVCSSRFTRQRAKRIRTMFQRLEVGANQPVRTMCLVFTLPKEVRPHEKQRLVSLREAARAIVNWWVAKVNGLELDCRGRPGWKLAGVDCWHPVGKDVSTWHPHLHMELPCIAWWKESLGCDCDSCKAQRWRRLRARVSKDDLKILRHVWGLYLKLFLGWRGNPYKVSINYEWRTSLVAWKYNHRIRYDFRHWPGWAGDWRRIAWWGYLSPAAIKKTGLPKEEDIETDEEFDEHDFDDCPECGRKSDLAGLYIGKRTPWEISRKYLVRVGAPAWLQGASDARKQPKNIQIVKE